MNKKSGLACSVLAILVGVFFVIYGGYDDSPGGQLLGLLAIVLGAAWMIKNRKK